MFGRIQYQFLDDKSFSAGKLECTKCHMYALYWLMLHYNTVVTKYAILMLSCQFHVKAFMGFGGFNRIELVHLSKFLKVDTKLISVRFQHFKSHPAIAK